MFKRLALILFVSVALAACRSGDNEPEAPVEPETQTMPTREARTVRQREAPPPVTEVAERPAPATGDPSRQLPRFQGELQSEGFGLSLILDGSSPQAFRDSLELAAQESSSEQLRSLHSSLEYLRMHSLGHPDLASFYRSLDGMTGEEIIRMANERRRR
ncbi:MAG: hypothetical protein EA370_06800 [Wenzhouxiangella sp.]|nr:MAG: hypothetical protein EA370_06800 [Wenzhouxiangella sp.]